MNVFHRRRFHMTVVSLSAAAFALGGWLMLDIGGSAQPSPVLRGAVLPSESTLTVNAPQAENLTAVISCVNPASSSRVSASTSVVIPVELENTIRHEGIAFDRFGEILFTVNATNDFENGPQVTLVNRVVADQTCDVVFLQ